MSAVGRHGPGPHPLDPPLPPAPAPSGPHGAAPARLLLGWDPALGPDREGEVRVAVGRTERGGRVHLLDDDVGARDATPWSERLGRFLSRIRRGEALDEGR